MWKGCFNSKECEKFRKSKETNGWGEERQTLTSAFVCTGRGVWCVLDDKEPEQ